jgi:hypothetical protein
MQKNKRLRTTGLEEWKEEGTILRLREGERNSDEDKR